MLSTSELLTELAGPSSNARHLELLSRQLETPIGIVPFVGAGLSAAFGFPTWTSFLRLLAEEAGLEDPIERRLAAGELEKAADELLQELRHREFQDVLLESFGDRRLGAEALGGAVGWVPHLSAGPVFTTNFDHVLERVFCQARCDLDHVLWGAQVRLGITAIRENKSLLLKLHGDVDDPDDRILTASDYARHYGTAAGADAVDVDFDLDLPSLLQIVLASRPLLFLGCSLEQDRTVAILLHVAEKFADAAHFAVLEQPEDKKRFRERRRFLADHNIRPIWYPKGRHDLIEPLVELLAGQVPDAFKRPNLRLRPAGDSVRHFPATGSSFIGRQAEITRLGELLESHRLLTLLGPGGCGKTRLAIELARRVADRFPDGVAVVELAVLQSSDHELVPNTVARALGLQEQKKRTPTDILGDHLANRDTLLVVDNCEHLIKPCAELIRELIEKSTRLRILATSRQVLDLGCETLFPLRPLRAPQRATEPDPRRLARFEAVQLFVERGRALDPSFTLDATNAAAVARICRRLDGIPLALELAAGRLKGLSAQQIAERLDQAFELLRQKRYTTVEHHRTLAATFDWSFDLLRPELRRFLVRLSVFDGGWTLEAAAEICGEGRGTELETLDALEELIDRSLVETRERDGGKRYTLLETIRQYSRAKLDPEAATTLEQRHRDWYLGVAENAAAHLLGAGQATWLDVLEIEHANLRSAIDSAVDGGDTESAMRLGAALWRFWEIRGYLEEGRRRLGVLLAQPGDDTTMRGRILDGAGTLAYRQTDLEAAGFLYRQALELARRLGDRDRLANALIGIGIVAGAAGRYSEAREAHQESLALIKQDGDAREIAVALHNLGNTHLHEGRYEKASEILRQSIGLFEEAGNLWESGLPLHARGRAALARGDVDLAAESFATGLERRRGVGAKRGMSDCLNGLGRVALAMGDLKKAGEYLREALNLRFEVDAARGIGESLETLAYLAARQEDFSQTALLLAAAEARRQEAGIELAIFYRQDHDTALAAAGEALSEAELTALRAKGAAMTRDELVALIENLP